MKNKLHSLSVYPLVLIFSHFLKGKKKEYKNFFIDKKIKSNQRKKLEVSCTENSFYKRISLFFDKNSIIYDKTLISFEINISKPPEEKSFIFDFLKVVNIFHAMSMLGAKIPNENIEVELVLKKVKLNDTEINNLLRYSLLVFASKKVDKLYFDKEILINKNSLLAYETMISYLNDSSIINFSNAKSLYVLTCKKNKKTFDIIWSSQSDIELTDANKVYDKYGELQSNDVKITNSPIYAFHK